MPEDDYELLPHAELEFLRREVDRLKRNPLGDTEASVGLLESMNSLNDNISRLVKIFQSANDDMARLQRDGNALEQMRRLREENAKIAHGIVALSEMFKNMDAPLEAPSEPQMPEPTPPVPEPIAAPIPEPFTPSEHDDVVQGVSDTPNPFMDEPVPPPNENMDQFTGEPLPPPPRR